MANPAATLGSTGKFGDLKRRLLFLVGALIVYRIGAHIPVPGIDPQGLAELFQSQQGGILGVFNLFSGGALSRFTIFALGIMPYISASIIMQLMTVAVPQLEALKKDGVLDNTAIFFMGNNGRCLLRGKQWLYDAGTRVPLIVKAPGAGKPGSVRDDPVIALDMTAQTLRLAGLPLPAPFHGQPLWGDRVKPREHAVTARDRCDMTRDRIRAVRDRRWKYIRNFMPERPYTQYNEYILKQYPTRTVLEELHKAGKLNEVQSQFMVPRKPEIELYDTQTDPHEVRNLAADPAQRGRVQRMGKLLDEWMKATGDRGGEQESEAAMAL